MTAPQWQAQTYHLWHPLGLFCCYEMLGRWYATRAHVSSETLGSHDTLVGAQAACAARIAQILTDTTVEVVL
jgi:hypothetical protein